MGLTYGSYAHPITPAVVMSEERLGAPTGARQGTRRRWTITGRIIGTAGSSVATQVAALEAAYAADGEDLTLYANDGVTVLDQLDSSAAAGGTRVVTRPEYPEGKGAQWATIRDYRIIVEGDFLTVDALGTNAWGRVQSTRRLQTNGSYVVSVSGEFTGATYADALAAADAEKLGAGYIAIEESQTSDEDARRVSFEYSYEDSSAGREVIEFSEEIGLTAGGGRVVCREAFGVPPTKQTTTTQPARGYQRGSAVGRTRHPDFPSYAWSATDLSEQPEKAKMSPKRLAGGLTVYPIRWNYQFTFTETPVLPTPQVPPDGSDQPT